MYQALYRKYRPLIFEDVFGQEHIISTIKNQIINNQISHAYMFTGTRGTGKTTCAKILARAVNCPNSTDGNPCNECEICKGILSGGVMDVFEIDAASNNGVDNIRELRDDVIFTPASAKYKVYIIDEVHMLSVQAFNALLKTLEEPPSHVIFVFATTEINKVPQTILSRCQRFDFKRITIDDIAKRLSYVAECEGFELKDNAAMLIAKLADGAMRDALSILDRCVNGNKTVTLEIVEKTVGICSYESVSSALYAIVDSDTDSLIEFYNDCRKNSKDTISLFSELTGYMRDLLLIKISKDPEKFLAYDQDKFDKLKELSDNMSVDLLLRSIKTLQDAIVDITKYKDKHIMAEIALIKLANRDIGLDIESVADRLSRLETDGVKMQTVSKPVKPKVDVESQNNNIPIEKPALRQTTNNKQDCEFWPQLITELDLNGGKSFTMFLRNLGCSVQDNVLKIFCSKNEFAYMLISKADSIEAIKKCAKTITGIDYQVQIVDSQTAVVQKNDSLDELLIDANDILIEE